MGNWTSRTITSAEVLPAEQGRKRYHSTSEEQGHISKKKRTENRLNLPPEIWALALDCLVYSDVLTLTLVSPFFLNHVLPKVQNLFLDNKNQLDYRQAHRLQSGSIQNVFFLSYLTRTYATEEGQNRDTLCEDTVMRSTPFLQHLPTVKYVLYGGFDLNENEGPKRWFAPKKTVCYRKFALLRDQKVDFTVEDGIQWNRINQTLYRSYIQAFHFRLLPNTLRLCNSTLAAMISSCEHKTMTCRICRAAYESFPLPEVYRIAPNCLWRSFTCLVTEEVVEILLLREGGREFLRDPMKLLPFVCSCFQHIANPCHQDLLHIIERLVIDLRIDPGRLTRDDIRSARESSFEEDWPSAWPAPTERTRDAISVFQKLVAMGFPLLETDFLVTEEDEEYLEQ